MATYAWGRINGMLSVQSMHKSFPLVYKPAGRSPAGLLNPYHLVLSSQRHMTTTTPAGLEPADHAQSPNFAASACRYGTCWPLHDHDPCEHEHRMTDVRDRPNSTSHRGWPKHVIATIDAMHWPAGQTPAGAIASQLFSEASIVYDARARWSTI